LLVNKILSWVIDWHRQI